MNLHPALSMVAVWLGCTAVYLLLPFQLLEWQLSWRGGLVFALFLIAFIIGSLLFPGVRRPPHRIPGVRIDSRRAENWLVTACALASIFFVLDAHHRDLFNLAAAYIQRSETADALLKGEVSASSVWFKMAFVLYPAAYVLTAVHVLFARRISRVKLVVFGLLPIALATAVMGGRLPIFYLLLVSWMALRERRKVGHASDLRLAGRRGIARRLLILGVAVAAVGALLYYFASVFMVRAQVVGGAAEMFDVAEQSWGMGFRGPLSALLFRLLGDEAVYLLFIFVWYLVQGLVVGSYLFSAYDGPTQFGVYGIDLLSAFMRRLDPQRMSEGFDSLLTLGTYGFFPSAWGSLYVDFALAGLLFCLVWGALAGLTYQRVVCDGCKDWLLIGPFVSVGIALSTINTPLGVANGLVTHGWLLFGFFMLARTEKELKSKLPATARIQLDPA